MYSVSTGSKAGSAASELFDLVDARAGMAELSAGTT
jgi:hypothetical protein